MIESIDPMWFLALGVFVGNWLFVPVFNKKRTFTDGFFIGLIAAVITATLMILLKLVT